MRRSSAAAMLGLGLLIPGAVAGTPTTAIAPSVVAIAAQDPDAEIQAVVSFRELVPAESALQANKLIRIEQFFHAFRASDGTTWVGGYLLGADESATDAVKSYLEAELYLVTAAVSDVNFALEAAAEPEASDLAIQLKDLQTRLAELSAIGIQVYAIQVTGPASDIAALPTTTDLSIESINLWTGTGARPVLPWEDK